MGIADDINAGMSVANNLYRNRMARDQSQVTPQMLQAQLALQNANAGIAGINQQFMPDLMQQKLLTQQITNQYLPQTLGVGNLYKAAMARYMSNPSMTEKYMTPLGKSYVEPGVVNATLNQPTLPGGIAPNAVPAVQQQLNSGPAPTGIAGTPSPQQMPPMQQQAPNPQAMQMGGQANGLTVDPQQLQDAYAAMRQKQTSDATTRQKSNYAVNIQKTFDEMDPSVISTYSGVGGMAQLKTDQAKALAGTTTPQYEKYNNFVKVQVPILADQVRQFYGASIQPEMNRSLMALSNPITWNTNPQLALSQFNALKELMNKEMATYQGTLNAPIRPYQGKQTNAAAQVINVPSFNSKAEFQNWYAQLGPAVQVALRQQLGGK